MIVTRAYCVCNCEFYEMYKINESIIADLFSRLHAFMQRYVIHTSGLQLLIVLPSFPYYVLFCLDNDPLLITRVIKRAGFLD